MKWADYGYTADWFTRNRYGVLGRDWIIPPAGTVAVDGGPALFEDILKWGEPQSAFWGYNFISWGIMNSYNRARSLTDPFEFEYVIWQQRDLHWPYRDMNTVPGALPFSVEEAREVTQIQALLGERVNTFFADVTVGRVQLTDATWNAYVTELDRMGLPRLLQLMQAAFDRSVWPTALGYKK